MSLFVLACSKVLGSSEHHHIGWGFILRHLEHCDGSLAQWSIHRSFSCVSSLWLHAEVTVARTSLKWANYQSHADWCSTEEKKRRTSVFCSEVRNPPESAVPADPSGIANTPSPWNNQEGCISERPAYQIVINASCVHTDWTITPPPPTTQNCGYISAEGIPKCRRCVMAAPRIKRSLFKAPTVQQIHLCSSVTFGFLLQRRRSLRRSDGSRRETEGGVFTFWAKASVIV